jgi:hypothetical protein
MDTNSIDDLKAQLKHLQLQVRFFSVVLVVSLALAMTFGILRLGSTKDSSSSILRARGLVIMDAQGHERILLGAPVPETPDRRRTDSTTGIILLGENGADRVAIGDPVPAPQVEGRVVARVSPEAGITFDDPEGNERGGFGYLDNGTVSLGLDYPNREAVMLSVPPQAGFAGLTINAPEGSESERAEIGVLKDGTSLLKLADTSGVERLMMFAQGELPAKLLGITPTGSGADIRVSWLNPDAATNLVFRRGQDFWREMANLKPPEH